MAMTEQQKISNDALSMWLDENHKGKWANHLGTFDSIEWKEGVTPPAESDYTAVQASYETKSGAYFNREYPSLGEQLDMMYHDQVNGTTTWKDAIAAIKAAHPKE